MECSPEVDHYELVYCDTTLDAEGDGSEPSRPVMEGDVANIILPPQKVWMQGREPHVGEDGSMLL